MVPLEPLLWTALALYAFLLHPTWYSSSVVCACLVAWTRKNEYSSPRWRRHSNNNTPAQHVVDAQGTFMSVVLVPVLLQSMALYNTHWLLYAKLTPFLVLSPPLGMLIVLVVLLNADLHTLQTIWLLVSFGILFTYCDIPSNVLTRGEWVVVSSLASVAITEWLTWKTNNNDKDYLYALVALSGVLGCVVGTRVTVRLQQYTWLRGMLMTCLPLATVECTLWWWQNTTANNNNNISLYPRSFMWLYDFLRQDDEEDERMPRYVWLVYWTILVVLALVLAPTSKNNKTSVVVARKWFHLVALVLFAPVTIMAPQLMSLSFAIVVCVLMIVEVMKPSLPKRLQDFYKMYLDSDKDPTNNSVVVSHMALIVGCALPLWMAQCTIGDTNSSNGLLPLFGILVLGIGDSLAAVVGTHWGRTPWKGRRRTLEGSLAMWIGMVFSCWLIVVRDTNGVQWIAAVTFTVLLEAVTTQIDNLVLPLAGATVLLLTNSTT